MQNLGNILLLLVILTLIILGNVSFAAENSLNLNPLDAVNSIGIGGFDAFNAQDVFKSFKLEFPGGFKNLNIDTNIPISPKFNKSVPGPSDINLKQFLTPKNISSDDLLKAAGALIAFIIEIFLVVISITAQMLRLVLGFLR